MSKTASVETEFWAAEEEAAPAGELELGLDGRAEAVVELCDCLIDLMADFFGVSGKELRLPGRSRVEIVRIRQIAMYLAHTLLRVSIKEVARGFGRDRSTVQYAITAVEDARDDSEIELLLGRLERITRMALQGRTVWSLR